MGGCFAQPQGGNTAQIERDLKQQKLDKNKEIKLLLLGAGESGKSTLFKQMKIIHHNGYTQEECQAFKDIIRSNLVQSMKALVSASSKLGISIEDENHKRLAQKINQFDQETLLNIGKLWTEELGQELAELWTDPGIQETYKRRNEFQILDSTEYFFNQIQTISKKEFLPTSDDVLRCRVKTTGIVETEFFYNDFKFKLFDVGGQRNERKKWIHCFDNVTAVIFVASLSEYDQKCYEDDQTLRMRESLVLFDEICNSRYFQDTDIILFFNKRDLFIEKIKHTDLKVCFKNYTGGCDYDQALAFIQKEFKDKNQDDGRQIYCEVTCATDTENIRKVFEAIKNIILKTNINK